MTTKVVFVVCLSFPIPHLPFSCSISTLITFQYSPNTTRSHCCPIILCISLLWPELAQNPWVPWFQNLLVKILFSRFRVVQIWIVLGLKLDRFVEENEETYQQWYWWQHSGAEYNPNNGSIVHKQYSHPCSSSSWFDLSYVTILTSPDNTDFIDLTNLLQWTYIHYDFN